MTKQPLVISQVLIDTIELFTIHRQSKQIEFQVGIDESLIVLGDAQRVQQIFYNILDNAIKYSDTYGEIQITLKKQAKMAQFQVQNYGTIIHEEDLPHIGERFFRSDKARNRKTGGSGLGLSIVKEITRLHDGQFSITSHQNEGTIVTVHIPLLKDGM